MTLYTKRAYLADIAANEAAAAAVAADLVRFNDTLEQTGTLTAELSDAWNAAYDRQYDIEQERADIERRFSRRRWTGADYATHDLIAANID